MPAFRTPVVILFAALLLTSHAQTTRSAPKSPTLHQLYIQDQRDRGVTVTDPDPPLDSTSTSKPPDQLDDKTLSQHDEQRRQQVRALLSEGKVTTARDFHDAAFIFQHGQSSDDYLLAHILAVEAVVKGDATSKWISAATLDRYLQTIGHKQVFGTQYLDKRLAYSFEHRSDADMTEKIKSIPDGMTQQPYDERLIPDALRLDFCVPNLEQQTINLAEFEKGLYPAGILPSGCTR